MQANPPRQSESAKPLSNLTSHATNITYQKNQNPQQQQQTPYDNFKAKVKNLQAQPNHQPVQKNESQNVRITQPEYESPDQRDKADGKQQEFEEINPVSEFNETVCNESDVDENQRWKELDEVSDNFPQGANLFQLVKEEKKVQQLPFEEEESEVFKPPSKTLSKILRLLEEYANEIPYY